MFNILTLLPTPIAALFNQMYQWYVGGVPKRVKVHLSSAQILLMNTTPVLCVTAPGTGYAIKVTSASASYVEVNNDYDAGTLVLSCDHTNANVKQFATGVDFLHNNGDNTSAHQYMVQQTPSTVSDNVLMANTPLYVYVPSANPIDGDATVDLYITYEILFL